MFGEADVAEEVMRMYGYDRINHTLPRGSAEPAMRTPRQKMESKVADRLASDGYYQIMTYSFTDPKLLADVGEDPEKAIKIMNPLGVENSVMRTSIISSLLEILETNYRYRNPSSALFEVGTVYLPKGAPAYRASRGEKAHRGRLLRCRARLFHTQGHGRGLA